MKRIVASLLALLMIVTMTPVVMAANLDFSGKVATEAAYGESFGGNSEIELSAKIGEDLKAGLSFGSKEKGFPWDNWDLNVTALWMETTGAIIPGTPEFTTRIGSLNHSYSDFVAKGIKTTGISMDKLAVGPVTLGGYYSLDHDSNLDRGAYVKVNPMNGIEAQATVVKADEQLAYALSTTVQPLTGAEVSGAYAAVHEGADAYRVNAKYQVLEGLEVRAGYQDIPTAFDATHRNTDADDDNNVNPGTGFTVGATANKFGFEVAADYVEYEDTLDYSIARTVSLAGLDFNTELAGNYDFTAAEAEKLEASVGYSAPNGLELTAGYDFIENQPKITAGLELQF
ncbi:MAG TPA: hypothetical protein GXZ97_10980 [Hydrogenispora sp.]|jgi:hypothetical protein|nr:hypothetical protein [Hydrogenispora sp.]